MTRIVRDLSDGSVVAICKDFDPAPILEKLKPMLIIRGSTWEADVLDEPYELLASEQVDAEIFDFDEIFETWVKEFALDL